MNKLLIVFLLCVMVQMVSAVECGVTPTVGCAITASTTFNTGSYNLNVSGANIAISINANNILIDCNNAIIFGNNSGYGFGKLTAVKNNVTLKNCYIQNYSRNIFLNNINNFSLQNITSNNTPSYGIYFRNASYSNITGSISEGNVSNSAAYGVIMDTGSTYNIVKDSYFTRCYHAINLLTSNYNIISNNTFFNTTHSAIVIASNSNFSNITNNKINYAGWNGLDIESFNNSILNNSLNNSYHHGIDYVNPVTGSTLTSSYNLIDSNNVSNSQYTAIYLQNLAHSIIQNNIVDNIINKTYDRSGIAVDGNSSINYGNLILDNLVKNVDNAFYIFAINSTWEDNTASNISGYEYIISKTANNQSNNITINQNHYDSVVDVWCQSNITNINLNLTGDVYTWIFNASFFDSGSCNIYFTDLDNSLIYYNNNTGIYPTPTDYNASMERNNITYLFTSFNLNDTSTRLYSPISLSGSSTSKTVSSNLTDAVNVTAILTVTSCSGDPRDTDDVSYIQTLSAGGTDYVNAPFSCTDTTHAQIMFNNIANGDNYIKVVYVTQSLDSCTSVNSGLNKMFPYLGIIMAIVAIGFLAMFVYVAVEGGSMPVDIETFIAIMMICGTTAVVLGIATAISYSVCLM